MLSWARRSTFYHLMIDRFATGNRRFRHARAPHCGQALRHWMGGDLNGVVQSLEYLQDLGIGALVLTPFFTGRKYHGYWTTEFLQIDPHFGDPQTLRQLVCAAHQRDMRVIMDLPFTHCHRDAAPARQALDTENPAYRDWFHYEEIGRPRGFYGDRDLPELNLEHPEVIEFIKKILDHWLDFGIDGIRFDHAKRPSTTFWRRLTDFLRARHPTVFLLGENWHESGRIGTLSGYLHGELNIPMSTALRRFLARPGVGEVGAIMHQVQTQQALREAGYLLPAFLDNHDMERASLIAGGDRAVLKLGYLLQLTLPYPPIIYYGSERAQSQTTNLPAGQYERDRYFREPMDWEQGEDMVAWVRNLVRIRNDNIDLFTSEPRALSLRDDHTFTYCYSNGDSTLAVAINFGPRSQRITPPSASGATLLTGGATRLTQGHIHIDLPAYSGTIFKSVRRGH